MMQRESRNWMWTEACTLVERAERLQRDFCWPSASGAQHIGWEPPVDIYETERQFCVHAALPGVEPSNLEVAARDGYRQWHARPRSIALRFHMDASSSASSLLLGS